MPIASAARSKAASEDRRAERSPATDAGEHEIVGRLAAHVLGEFVDEEARDWHLALLVPLRRPPHLIRAYQRHGLGDHGAAAKEVEATNAQRGHLAEADAV
jgi:hypothetical protein